ncbi:ABC transporter permease [Sagittula stellata]|uniref:ABC transporter, permease protein n=1 Tax=Sagittula stellata (strain ATCC 700073 / DSM 11524 / E-37) TaxID=388399 RepID=A3K4F1_SAGS3|nr:ABC transporter permease [Sagittula stellata]EBA07850.1 ABC transporter, permease protein [Sagittula stellata E-37]
MQASSSTSLHSRFDRLLPYLQIAPLALVLFVFLLIPLGLIVVVSFWDYDSFRVIPAFVTFNYAEMLSSPTIWRTMWSTVQFTLLTLAITGAIGFLVAYYIAFYVRSPLMKTIFFMACTIPFLTSNIIRMISWVPFLGRNGLINSMLMDIGLIAEPLDFLLYSRFAVVLVYVYLFTLFMVTPLFNAMARIDRSVIEAAVDAGASPLQIMFRVVAPLTKTGFAIGAVFIITLVMGDFVTVRLMGGGQSASTGLLITNQISLLQYPAACANAVLLLVVVMIAIGGILRNVDIRRAI